MTTPNTPDPDVTLAELAHELAAVKAERDKYRATLAVISVYDALPGVVGDIVELARLTIAAAKGE